MSATPVTAPLICPSSNIPGLVSVNGTAFTAVKGGGHFTDVGNSLVVNGVSVHDHMAETKKRLDMLESNIKALPATIAESIAKSFSDISWHHSQVVTKGGDPTDMFVNMGPSLSFLALHIQKELFKNINFDELNKLRDRIRQLEEDMGYREAVAKKLMEP